jgi:hypothetical protein
VAPLASFNLSRNEVSMGNDRAHLSILTGKAVPSESDCGQLM